MNVNTENLVSITEANQNFSRVARMVDEKGPVVILKTTLLAICWLSSTTLNRNSLLTTKMYLPFPNV